MPKSPELSVREVLLDTTQKLHERLQGGSLQQSTVLQAAAEALQFPHYGDRDKEEALLTHTWQDYSKRQQ